MEEGRGISDKAFHDRHSFDTRRRGGKDESWPGDLHESEIDL